MGAILSKLWPNKSNHSNNSNDQPPLAITAPPVRLPLPSPSVSDANLAIEGKDSSNHGKKASKKQQSGQQSTKPSKNDHPFSNQSFIYKTVLEATVSDAKANEEEEKQKAEEAPGPFEIETDLLSPEIEEAVIKIQANVRGYLTRKQYRSTPERTIEKPVTQVNQEPTESSNSEPLSGLLAPPPSFSDTPKELPPDEDDAAASQGKKIAEKLIELEKQVNRATRPLENRLERHSGEVDENPVQPILDNSKSDKNNSKIAESSTEENNYQRPLEIPTIETDLSESYVPEEAATKIQAAFRGYQVRKSMSRETSPCKSKEKPDELNSESVEEYSKVEVHLREKEANSNQDPERESILVLTQLEECLSQELMRTSVKIEDETSLSSHSTDVDLNSSLRSNCSLIPATQNEDTVEIIINKDEALMEVESYSNDVNDNKSQDLIVKSESSPRPDNLFSINDVDKDDKISSSNIEQVVDSKSPNDDQVSKDASSNLNDSECTEKLPDQTYQDPVIFTSSDEKVDAASESSNIDSEIKDDLVVLVELDGTLDASNVSVVHEDTKQENQMKSNKNEKIEETVKNGTQSHSHESHQSTSEPDSRPSISVKSKSDTDGFSISDDQFAIKSEEIFKSNGTSCPQSDLISEQEIHPLSETIIANKSGSVQQSELENNELSSTNIDASTTKQPTEPSCVHDASPSTEQLTLKPKEPTLQAMDIPLIDKKAEIKNETNLVSESKDFSNDSQKTPMLLKEDSFGSDILILDEEMIDKSDTLYDIIVDKGLATNELVDRFASVVDSDIKDKKNDGSLHCDTATGSSKSSEFPLNIDNSESIAEIKDDILVNLDESDDEHDKIEKKKAEETISTISITTNVEHVNQITSLIEADNENDRLINEKANTCISSDSDQHLAEEPVNLLSTNPIDKPISTSDIKSIEITQETSVKTIEHPEEFLDEKLDKKQVTSCDMIPNKTMISTIEEVLDEQTIAENFESIVKRSISSDDQSNKQQEVIVAPRDEKNSEQFSNHDIINQEVTFTQVSTSPSLCEIKLDADLIPKSVTSTDIQNQDLPSASSQSSKIEVLVEESSSLNVLNKSDEYLNMIKTKDEQIAASTSEERSIHLKQSSTEKDGEQTDLIESKISEDSNELKDDKSKLSNKEEEKCSTSLEAQPKLQSVQNISPITIITKESEQILEKELQTDTVSTSSTVPTVDQAELIEISASDSPAAAIESPSTEESDGKIDKETEDSSPEDENRLLKIHDRDARSKSPNPFGRKRRKGKRGRGGQ